MSLPAAPIRGESPHALVTHRTVLCALLLFLITASVTAPLCAESAPSARRKPVYTVDPDYPPELKRAYIGGTVRLNLLISASGTVEEVSVLGGNPALADAAVRAVKKWKYAHGPTRSSTRVDFVFSPYK
jgi:TonB family protein